MSLELYDKSLGHPTKQSTLQNSAGSMHCGDGKQQNVFSNRITHFAGIKLPAAAGSEL